MRLHLIKLLDLQSSPTVLPSALAHHVESITPPSEEELGPITAGPFLVVRSMHPAKSSFGGSGRICTAVHSAFTWKELQQFFNRSAQFLCGLRRWNK